MHFKGNKGTTWTNHLLDAAIEGCVHVLVLVAELAQCDFRRVCASDESVAVDVESRLGLDKTPEIWIEQQAAQRVKCKQVQAGVEQQQHHKKKTTSPITTTITITATAAATPTAATTTTKTSTSSSAATITTTSSSSATTTTTTTTTATTTTTTTHHHINRHCQTTTSSSSKITHAERCRVGSPQVVDLVVSKRPLELAVLD
jgi:hypothetical protein